MSEPDLAAKVLVAGEGFLAVAALETVGLVADLPGDDVRLLGTVEVRRAAEVKLGLFFSSSEMDGCDLCVAVVPAGFLIVAPEGGRAGGLLKPPVAERAAELAVVLVAAAGVVTGRRVVAVVPAGRFAGAAPSGLDPLTDLVEDFGEDSVTPVPAVPLVSSPERRESSLWGASTSDMISVFTR